jgi:hypothetical protein
MGIRAGAKVGTTLGSRPPKSVVIRALEAKQKTIELLQTRLLMQCGNSSF